ncbi:hypothetical protein GGI06_004861 [Coemansia sp. S85]|nr:hypothetical protein GGI06_004861 [Coemansia sp. S85]
MSMPIIELVFFTNDKAIKYPIIYERGKTLGYYLQMEETGPKVNSWINKNVKTQSFSFSMKGLKLSRESAIGDIKRKAQALNPFEYPIVAYIHVGGDYPSNENNRPILPDHISYINDDDDILSLVGSIPSDSERTSSDGQSIYGDCESIYSDCESTPSDCESIPSVEFG